MKVQLITYKKELKQQDLNQLARHSKYDKIFCLTTDNLIDLEAQKSNKKLEVIKLAKRIDIPQQIDQLFKDKDKKTLLLPHFEGDSNSKYAIKVYNRSFKTKVDSNLFKLKNRMNDFLKEVANKANQKFTYSELMEKSYQELVEILGSSFILKPTNAASSLFSFKISSPEDFAQVKKKISKKYQYILEKFIEGNLYAVDLFCDGKDTYVLCHTREITFSEFIEKFTTKYKNKYQHLYDDYLYYIPIRYNLDFSKISKTEEQFIKQVGEKLKTIKYRGVIHLEYKVNKKSKEIGFIEWGARHGLKRSDFIMKMFNVTSSNLPYDLIYKEDRSDFTKKNGLFFLRNRNLDNNIIGIKTTVPKKTNIVDILKKTGNFLEVSYDDYIKSFLEKNWQIKVKKINYFLKTSEHNFLYPHTAGRETSFNYVIDLDEKNHLKFLKNKAKIIECLIFHDFALRDKKLK